MVTITLPVGLTFAGSDGSFDNATDVWSVGNVAAGAAAHLRITATVAAGTGGTTLVTSAAVTSADQSDPVAANDGAGRGGGHPGRPRRDRRLRAGGSPGRRHDGAARAAGQRRPRRGDRAWS